MTFQELGERFDSFLKETSNAREDGLRLYNVDAARAVCGLVESLPERVVATLAIDSDRDRSDRPHPAGSRPNLEQAVRYLKEFIAVNRP